MTCTSGRIHGHVAKNGQTWYSVVYDSTGECVFEDNANNWRAIFDGCIEDVTVARRIEDEAQDGLFEVAS